MSAAAPRVFTESAVAPHGLPRLLAGINPHGVPLALGEHVRQHGRLPVRAPGELISAVDASGLRGRGGADFPTARKLKAVASRSRQREPVVVVNGSETEPASAKDALMLSQLPHLVLDGAELAARAVGSREVIVKLSARATAAERAVTAAVAERREGPVEFYVAVDSDRYVAGEETAVVNFLGGKPGLPAFVPPRPFERGLRGRPTLIQNVETLAQIALVARYGPRWYRELGTDADPGTALVTITGAVAAPGVYELAFGTSLRDLLSAAGGATEPLQALLIGGYFGTWVEAQSALRLRLAREDLRSVGCSLGSGVLVALGESACGLHESSRVVDYLAHQSAGQCGPCVYGLSSIADAFAALADGLAHRSERDRLLRWTAEIRGRGACHHPDGAVRFTESALRVFAGAGHSRHRCPGGRQVLPIPERA